MLGGAASADDRKTRPRRMLEAVGMVSMSVEPQAYSSAAQGVQRLRQIAQSMQTLFRQAVGKAKRVTKCAAWATDGSRASPGGLAGRPQRLKHRPNRDWQCSIDATSQNGPARWANG